jgi:hypothetical protein
MSKYIVHTPNEDPNGEYQAIWEEGEMEIEMDEKELENIDRVHLEEAYHKQ